MKVGACGIACVVCGYFTKGIGYFQDGIKLSGRLPELMSKLAANYLALRVYWRTKV